MRAGLRWVSGTVWALSWYTMYLEVRRWHHLTPRFRFDPPPPAPGGVRPRPGRPLRALRVAAALAPLVFVATVVPRGRRA